VNKDEKNLRLNFTSKSYCNPPLTYYAYLRTVLFLK